MLIGTLYSVAVDPDEVLRLFRGLSFSSALSATIATRMVPVLRARFPAPCRCSTLPAGRPPGRAQLLRATTAGVLDRALDVAATLEVRGYGIARQRARGRAGGLSCTARAGRGTTSRSRRPRWWCWRSPWRRGSPAGRAFTAYPLLRAPAGARTLELAALLVLAALAPFADRRGVVR